ncbi:DNA repair protein rhp54 [Hordeum vulgare]|nr:DNA repair protein rhp54 [Hordeum vulgare]
MLPRLAPCIVLQPCVRLPRLPASLPLLGECSPEVSVVAPSTPAPTNFALNATQVAGGSSSGGARKLAWQTPADQLSGAHNLFDEMPAADNDDYMQNMIFEGGLQAAGFDSNETQSQDG